MNQTKTKRTSLYDWHLSKGAKMVPFAGWEMPLSYSSQIEEHLRTRSSVSIFDVSHMGEIMITGSDAADFCDWLLPNKVKTLKVGEQTSYHPLCRQDGTVVDDLLLYFLKPDMFLLCVNASNTQKDFAFIASQAKTFGFKGQIENVSDHYAQIAIQGPKARVLVQLAFPDWGVETMKRFRFCLPEGAASWVVSRTGYTGEDGVEVYLPPASAREWVDQLMQVAHQHAIDCAPAGLGARDTLRLEAGYPLYGHELDDEHTAIESGLAMFCDFSKADFCGKAVLQAQKNDPSKQKHRLMGFATESRRAPRAGQLLANLDGQTIGKVVSGAFAPNLGHGIGMGFVDAHISPLPEVLQAQSGQGTLTLKRMETPFWSSLKKKKASQSQTKE